MHPLKNPPLFCSRKIDHFLLEEPTLKAVASRLKKTVAQVVLRFQIQRNIIVIPKSVTPSRIEENMNVSALTCITFFAYLAAYVTNKPSDSKHFANYLLKCCFEADFSPFSAFRVLERTDSILLLSIPI